MPISHRQAPRNYLSRPEQRRLLILVGMLGLVVLLMQRVGDPKNWEWFTKLGEARPALGAEAIDLDTRLRPTPQEQAVLGGFIAQAQAKPGDPQEKQFFPGVQPELLKAVKDDTPHRGPENHAFYHLLKALQDADPAQIERATTGNKGFSQLHNQPHAYRGELVTVKGVIRQASPLEAMPNDFGVQHYHLVWIQPSDSPTFPLAAYVLELPEGLKPGMDMNEEIELTGFFYKRWAYQAKDDIRTAPMLLARTVRWTQPVAADKPPLTLGKAAIVISAALAISAVVVYLAMTGQVPTRRDVRNRQGFMLPSMRPRD